MIKYNFLLFLLLALAFSITSCSEKEKNEPLNMDLVRFDQLLMELDTLNIRESFSQLENQYPEFNAIYFSEVLPLPGYPTRNDTFFTHLNGFINDQKIRELYKIVQEQYPDLNDELLQIQSSLSRAKQWFPSSSNPRIYTFISEFGYQRFLFEDEGRDGLAIGLDLFLEDILDYSFLESGTNTFSKYLTRTYNKEHLVKKVMDAWLEDKMGLVRGDRLIDHMIFNGTKLHILEEILEVPDSIITEYPEEKLQWLDANEKEMWSFYFQNEWFYTTDQYVIKRLVQPAPNSVALRMPADAPGQTGNFLGWKIVKSYIKRFPESDIQELLNTDAQQILEASKYKPGSN